MPPSSPACRCGARWELLQFQCAPDQMAVDSGHGPARVAAYSRSVLKPWTGASLVALHLLECGGLGMAGHPPCRSCRMGKTRPSGQASFNTSCQIIAHHYFCDPSGRKARAISSAGLEHYLDKVGVAGSNPALPTEPPIRGSFPFSGSPLELYSTNSKKVLLDRYVPARSQHIGTLRTSGFMKLCRSTHCDRSTAEPRHTIRNAPNAELSTL